MQKDWLKLKENICPLCGDKIIRSDNSDYNCFNCGFFCHRKKAQQIITDVEYNQSIKEHDKMVDEWIAKNSK